MYINKPGHVLDKFNVNHSFRVIHLLIYKPRHVIDSFREIQL